MAARAVPPPGNRREFEIAIICALPVEFDAVEAIFDHFWDEDGDRYGKALGDQNAYTTGIIGKHNVVLAHMPGIGRGHAAKVAATFHSSFEGIKVALVVGVCGGVPTGTGGSDNIFLGDVIISDDVVVYDFGKKLPGGQFIHKNTISDHSGSPSTEVRAFLNKLRSRRGRQQLTNRSSYHLFTLQKETNDHQYPGRRHDKLFELNYHHKHRAGTCKICSETEICEEAQLSTCKKLGCDESRLVSRPCSTKCAALSGTEQAPLRIHFGRMASGDTVMKSGEDRDGIALKQKVIAFEMEGAGVLNSLPCIIIKGVSDYADSHKDKSWQNFAAGAAAACMKALLEQWATTDRLDLRATETLSAQNRADTIRRGSLSSSESFDTQDTASSQTSTHDDNKCQIKNSKKLLQVLRAVETSFKSVLSCFKEFRKYLPQDIDMKMALRVQRDTFRTIVEALLSQAQIPLEITRDMVININHCMWDDTSLHNSIFDHFGQSAAALVRVARAVHENLMGLESLTKNLKAVSKRKVVNQPLGLFPNPASMALKEALQDTKLLVQNLSFLVPSRRETQKLESSTALEPARSQWKDLKDFRIIQQAATSLHCMLEKSCTSHAIHSVHLTLQPDLNKSMTQVKFNVALRGHVQDLQSPSRSTWIDIESTIDPSKTPTSMLASASITTLEHPPKDQLSGGDAIATEEDGKSSRRVHFSLLSKLTQGGVSNVTNDFSDLFLNGGICTIIQQPPTSPDRCIGVFADGEACKHVLYSANQSYNTVSTCASLTQLISTSRSDLANGLSLYERIRLAKYLATAVLYYHATPWLDKSWYGDDVYFFTNEDGDDDQILRQAPQVIPYIRTSLPSGSICTECDDFIRNPVLFGLGIMFLELAYQAPLSALHNSIDRSPGKSPGLVRYSTARRLAEKVHSIISVGFRRIVEKCLYCDFGHGNNFKSPALQQAFYREIMGELDELESFFKKLQHDDQD
ncbi:hypothetical protein BDV06DRAFT_229872 [Aspergillus oleicola]